MHLAYSSINSNFTTELQPGEHQQPMDNERVIRYRAYQIACSKYADEIIAIQKYFPGWLPRFS